MVSAIVTTFKREPSMVLRAIKSILAQKNTDIISFLDKRIERISKELSDKKNRFDKSKEDLFSDNIFNKNIASFSKMSLLIKR